MAQSIKNITATLLLAPTLLFMTGCGRNINSGNYSEASIGEAMTSYIGTIVSKRNVTVSGADKLGENQTGVAVGALAGGIGGSAIGGGRGSALAALGGAVIGSVAGAYAEQELSKQNGIEYTVKIDNTGELKTITQGLDVNLAIGSRVIVHIAQSGKNAHSRTARSRIVPYNGL